MYLVLFIVSILSGISSSSHDDLGYDLRIGNAIDIFANYGDLSLVTQVVSADPEEDNEGFEPPVPFKEKNIRLFTNITSEETGAEHQMSMDVHLCDSLEMLLETYFQNFKIEGIDTPWKAFMGDWILDEIPRAFGIEYNGPYDNGYYVLLKMSKTERTVKLGDLTGVKVKDYVKRAISNLNMSDTAQVRRFMTSYGTHYIDSFSTGDVIYQVFRFKPSGYHLLKSYMRSRNNKQKNADNLRFYFSSYFLKQVGNIKVASGNKTIETWARRNLLDSQYKYSMPNLMRLYYSLNLAKKLNTLLETNKALLAIDLKLLKPIFKDRRKGERYLEVINNDLRLWEINS